MQLTAISTLLVDAVEGLQLDNRPLLSPQSAKWLSTVNVDTLDVRFFALAIANEPLARLKILSLANGVNFSHLPVTDSLQEATRRIGLLAALDVLRVSVVAGTLGFDATSNKSAQVLFNAMLEYALAGSRLIQWAGLSTHPDVVAWRFGQLLYPAAGLAFTWLPQPLASQVSKAIQVEDASADGFQYFTNCPANLLLASKLCRHWGLPLAVTELFETSFQGQNLGLSHWILMGPAFVLASNHHRESHEQLVDNLKPHLSHTEIASLPNLTAPWASR